MPFSFSSVSAGRTGSSRWVLWMPALAALVLVLVLGLLGTVVWRDLEDERRDTLIQDILWQEQALRMRFQALEEWSQVSGGDIVGRHIDEKTFRASTSLLMRENPEVLRVERLDPLAQVIWHDGKSLNPKGRDRQIEHDALVMARKMGEPAYSMAYSRTSGQPLVDMVVPFYENDALAGLIRITISLNGLLYHQVPWWIAQKYQISIMDLDGQVLASKFRLEERPGGLTHEIEFTPPGNGLSLKATAYRVSTGIAVPLLAGFLVLLLLLLVFSLWKVRSDIKKRHKVESALQQEMALRLAIENSMKNGLFAIDAQGRITRVNRPLCHMLGLTPEQVEGCLPPYPFWPEPSRPELHESLRRILAGDIPKLGFEQQFCRKSGGLIDVRLYVTPLIDDKGGQNGWLASFYDITELKKKREAIAAAQLRLRTVLNGLDAPVCVSRCTDRQLLFSNRAFEENMLRQDGDASMCVVLPLPPGIDEMAEVIDADLQFHGSSRWYQLHRRKIEWVDGEPAWLGIYADVTETRQLAERERLHNEKLQATARLVTMGEMASSLAHELNQPLTAIATYSAGLLKKLDQPSLELDTLRGPLEKITLQARRAGQIIHGIRAFVKKHAPKLARDNPNSVIETVLTLAGPLISQHKVVLVTDLVPCPVVEMDRVLIEQVLLNLINNAVEAMRDGAVRDPRLTIRACHDGATVTVEVADNGPGIPPEQVEQLFTAFFSTKAEGMGIGLNICRSIIEYHRGEFSFEPNRPNGCIFRFTLPVAVGSAGLAAQSRDMAL